MTNSGGTVVVTRRYDSFGNLETGATNGYAFTGREWDTETGLAYLQSQIHDPKMGRFLSEILLDSPVVTISIYMSTTVRRIR
jgi:RHS repeat-associated protein